MMKIRIRVKHIDRYGFLGRDHHPEEQDLGVEGLVTSMDTEPNEFYPELATGGPQVFHVVLDNGRNVELLGHEIELVSCVHDGDL